MSMIIYAIDEQFAVSTGSNVNSSAGMSTFDYPPNSSKDLVIESHPGDPTPFVFSPGDTYTVSFAGHGGTTISDATVLRSDYIDYDGDQGHAIVFEGLDENGDLTQVAWSPDFNLEDWYWHNFHAGNPPGFYTTDQSAATEYQAPCFEASTLIATPDGLRRADTFSAGDWVVTHDGGPRQIRWVSRRRVRAMGRGAPIWFERGVLGNHLPLELSLQHRVLLQTPLAQAAYGQDQVLVPALALLNGATVRPAPRAQVMYVHLLLDDHALVTASGALCETLLMGEMTARILPDPQAPGLTPELASLSQTPCRPILKLRPAAELWRAMQAARPIARAVLGKRGKTHAKAFIFHPTPGQNCRLSTEFADQNGTSSALSAGTTKDARRCFSPALSNSTTSLPPSDPITSP